MAEYLLHQSLAWNLKKNTFAKFWTPNRTSAPDLYLLRKSTPACVVTDPGEFRESNSGADRTGTQGVGRSERTWWTAARQNSAGKIRRFVNMTLQSSFQKACLTRWALAPFPFTN